MKSEQHTYDVLRDLRSTDKLRELFSYLNYKYANRPISTRNWSDRTKEGLKQTNIIAEHDGFHVIHCTVDHLLRGIERPIITQILKDHPYSLIIFSDSSYQDWHFVNVKWDEEEKNRRLFRRIVIGPDEKLHTAAERISILEIEHDDLSVLEVQTKHDEAFDVEAVTKEFFNTFVDMYHLLREEIETNNPRYRDKA